MLIWLRWFPRSPWWWRFSHSIPHLVVLPWGICARQLLWEWSRTWRKKMLPVLRWQNLLSRRVASEPCRLILLKSIWKIMTWCPFVVYPKDAFLCIMRFLVLCLHHHHKAFHRIGFLIGGGLYKSWGSFFIFVVSLKLRWWWYISSFITACIFN